MSMAFNSLTPATTPRVGETSRTLRRLATMLAPAPSHNRCDCRARKRFDPQAFLGLIESAGKAEEFQRHTHIFAQGDIATRVFYMQRGVVKLSVVNGAGREAVVAMLGPGEFFGEGGLTKQQVRSVTATAITATTVLGVEKDEMERLLRRERSVSDRFIQCILSRNIRGEADLVDQLFNSAEKRLARTLLLLARYGEQDRRQTVLPKLSQETLSEMIGTTRSRVNLFLNKFKRMGFIHQEEGLLHINPSLLDVVLHE